MSLRNAPCHCGSGRRFKHCHGQEGSAALPPAAVAFPSAAQSGSDDAVDFVVAGTQRGGTTALDAYLREHPGVAMPRTRKELHFFDHDEHFVSEPARYGGYHAHFPPRLPGQLRGDVTPSYMYWAPAAARLARYNRALKVIVLLRNPITRAHSHWNKERQRGREALPFLAALEAEAARAKTALPAQDRRTSYAARGDYVGQLRRLWEHFPAGQTLVLQSDALRDEPAPTLARIADFLGIAPFPGVAPKAVNARAYTESLRHEEWTYLADRFTAEIRALERLLGWDCSDWLRPPASARVAAETKTATEAARQGDGGT